jgi:ubiquinone/menaquinone biosynthesis C-methylase UbiE
MSLAVKYDAINTAIFLPAGGSQRVRQRFVSALDVSPGHRVVELGCGTGQVTALLLAAGADVVALDPLAAMLEGARRRAPGATIIEGDLFDVEIPGPFDRVVLSFVLHNFDADGRMEALRRSARALASGGQVGILDWALPTGRIRASLWRRFLTRLEPSSTPVEVTDADLELKYLGGEAPNVSAVLDGAIRTDVRAAGLEVRSCLAVANGRAQIVIAHPQDTATHA